MSMDQEFDPDAGDPESWTPVEQGPRKRPPGMVLSVRVPGDLAVAIENHAREQGVSMSDLVREAIVHYLKGGSVASRYSVLGTASTLLLLAGPTVASGDVTRGSGGHVYDYAAVAAAS